jgi:hypothetical protein
MLGFFGEPGRAGLGWNCSWWAVVDPVELSLDWTAEAAIPTRAFMVPIRAGGALILIEPVV